MRCLAAGVAAVVRTKRPLAGARAPQVRYLHLLNPWRARVQLLVRFLIGGSLVSLFALAGDVLRPRSFAGLFGAAPSIALATLALTAAHSGAAVAAIEARSMTAAAGAFIAYAWVSSRLLRVGRWSSAVVASAALVVWALGAAGAWLLVR